MLGGLPFSKGPCNLDLSIECLAGGKCCANRRGAWWGRLTLNLAVHLKRYQEALEVRPFSEILKTLSAYRGREGEPPIPQRGAWGCFFQPPTPQPANSVVTHAQATVL